MVSSVEKSPEFSCPIQTSFYVDSSVIISNELGSFTQYFAQRFESRKFLDNSLKFLFTAIKYIFVQKIPIYHTGASTLFSALGKLDE
jgi:hypothetical protein